MKEMLIRAAGLPVFHNLLYPVLQEHASWYENLDKRIGTADNPFAVVDEESARLESDFERATRDALPLLSKGLFIKYGLPADGSGVASQKEAYRRFARGLPSEEEVNSAVLEVSVRLRPELDAEYQRKGRTLTDLRARLPEQEAARLTPETLSEIPAKENA